MNNTIIEEKWKRAKSWPPESNRANLLPGLPGCLVHQPGSSPLAGKLCLLDMLFGECPVEEVAELARLLVSSWRPVVVQWPAWALFLSPIKTY